MFHASSVRNVLRVNAETKPATKDLFVDHTTPVTPQYLAGSLERIIAQVDMEESGGSGTGTGRQDHPRPPADSSTGGYSGARGGGSGAGSGGGGAGATTTGSSGGWTDMFQGMTVEVRRRACRAGVVVLGGQAGSRLPSAPHGVCANGYNVRTRLCLGFPLRRRVGEGG